MLDICTGGESKKHLTTLEKKLDHPKKTTWTPLITIEPIKNKIQPLQIFGPLNVEQKNCKKCIIHNSFVKNPK